MQSRKGKKQRKGRVVQWGGGWNGRREGGGKLRMRTGNVYCSQIRRCGKRGENDFPTIKLKSQIARSRFLKKYFYTFRYFNRVFEYREISQDACFFARLYIEILKRNTEKQRKQKFAESFFTSFREIFSMGAKKSSKIIKNRPVRWNFSEAVDAPPSSTPQSQEAFLMGSWSSTQIFYIQVTK